MKFFAELVRQRGQRDTKTRDWLNSQNRVREARRPARPHTTAAGAGGPKTAAGRAAVTAAPPAPRTAAGRADGTCDAARSGREGHSLTQHGGHGAPDHTPARHHHIVERGGGHRAERNPRAGPQPPTQRSQQTPTAHGRHHCGSDDAPPASERKPLRETMTTQPARGAGTTQNTSSRAPMSQRRLSALESDWLLEVKKAGLESHRLR